MNINMLCMEKYLELLKKSKDQNCKFNFIKDNTFKFWWINDGFKGQQQTPKNN